MSVHFRPDMKPYKNLGSFRMWCQKVLPAVYDESLSYYEVLCKLKDYLNSVIENVDGLYEDMDALYNAYGLLEDYVNGYFDNLDVQAEINNKLDDMARDGSLSALIAPFVEALLPDEVASRISAIVESQLPAVVRIQLPPELANQLPAEVALQIPDLVTAWLNLHVVQPVEVIIDNSLTISGAAADAKTVGDAISELKSAFDYKVAVLTDAIPELCIIENSTITPQLTQGYANAPDGVIKNNAGASYYRSEFIYIPQNADSVTSNFRSIANAATCFYDEHFVFISSTSDRGIVTIPNGAKYIVLSDYNVNQDHSGRTITWNYNQNTIKKNDVVIADSYIGKIGSTADFDNVGFLDNNGIIQTSGFSAYAYSDPLPVDIGSTLEWSYTGSMLNTQLGGYFLGDAWVANLGSATPTDGHYSITLRNDIVYDHVVLNVYTVTPAPYEAYINTPYGIMDRYYKTLPEDIYIGANNYWQGKTWVALGDSWTEGAYVQQCGRYTDYVSTALGLSCINLGVGGSGVAKFAEQGLDDGVDKTLTQEIADSADLITIYGSINDMANNGIQCGDITDSASKNGTLMARWKYTIEKVLNLNPKARLVIIGCSVAFDNARRGYEPYNTYGDTIENSVKKIGELANHYGLPFINMFNLSGFNSQNFNGGYFDYDKVHPNRKGVMQTSNVIIGELKKIQPIYNPL